MGNGATKAKSVLQQELDKPVDASDITNFEAAIAEIRRLRNLIRTELDGQDGGKVLQSSSLKKRQSTLMSASGSMSGTKKKDRRGEVSAEEYGNMDKPPVYEKKVIAKSDDARAIIAAAVDDSVLFQGFSASWKADTVDAFFLVEANEGDTLISQGDQGDNFYVVEAGSLTIKVAHNNGPAVRHGEVNKGDSFGELALMYNTPRAATIEASSAVRLWALDRTTYRNIVQTHGHQKKQRALEYLKKVGALSSLSKREFERLASLLEEEVFEPNKVIIRQGEKGDHFYIIASGEVDVLKSVDGKESERVGGLTAGDYFGEHALKTEETRQATVMAKTEVRCLSVGRDVFIEVLGNLQELQDRAIPEESEAPTGGASDNKYAVEMKLEDLEIKQTLGCGAFGRVKLVRLPSTGSAYALKCLAKQDIVNNNLQGHVLNERDVMCQLDHPFILKLHNSFKDSKYLYLLLELALGGEMFTFLRKAGRFNEAAARFYAASTVLAFQHMHAKRICYRDLKPENLCLDGKGFLKVVDFGLAKYVADRTWTLCGTPDYLAPEIILSKGHDMAVDYWALGVLIYEMTAGFVPFYSDDPMEVYQLILSDDVRFPSHFSRACSDLVSKLLTSNQSKRLGNTKVGINGIIKHKWFSGFDWEGLLNFSMTPPIVPIVNGTEDVSNFDEYPEEEDVVPDCSWDPDF